MSEPCLICGKEYKNLGAHMYQAHQKETLVVDEELGKEKPLSDVLSAIRQVLNHFQNQITVKILEKNGKPYEVEVTAKIQL